MARGHGPRYSIAFSPGIWKGGELLGRLAAYLCAPLPFLWFCGGENYSSYGQRPWASLFYCLHSGIGKRRKLLGRLAAYLGAPLPHLWFMVPFPVVLLLLGHLVPVGRSEQVRGGGGGLGGFRQPGCLIGIWAVARKLNGWCTVARKLIGFWAVALKFSG